MGNAFDNIGSFKLASSGRSIKCRIVPPDSLFAIEFYIGLKEFDKVVQRRQKSGTIYQLKENAPRPESYKTREQKRVEAQMDL